MDLFAVVDQVIELLRSRGRVSYRALRVQFNLNDEAMDALKAELMEVHQIAADQAGTMLVWMGEPGTASPVAPQPTREPLAYTPPHLAEKILTSRSRPGRRAQAGHRALCRPQGLDGTHPRPRSRSRPAAPRSRPSTT